MKNTGKKLLILGLMVIAVMSFCIGCGKKTTDSDPVTSTDTSTDATPTGTTSNDIDATINDADTENTEPSHYDFISEAYTYYHGLGYSDNFISSLICVMFTEANGDSTTVEYGYAYPEEYAKFLESKNASTDELLEAYHNYGNVIFENNSANIDMYRDSNGEFCVGIGLMLWTGARGNDLLTYKDGDWTDREYQFEFLAAQLEYAGLTPEATADLESVDAGIALIASDFIMIDPESPHINDYKQYINEVNEVISTF